MKNPTAVMMGKIGGKRRAKMLTPEERQDIARQGGLAKAAKRNGTAAALVTETDLAESTSQTQKRKA